jgi:hypothetical protein
MKKETNEKKRKNRMSSLQSEHRVGNMIWNTGRDAKPKWVLTGSDK